MKLSPEKDRADVNMTTCNITSQTLTFESGNVLSGFQEPFSAHIFQKQVEIDQNLQMSQNVENEQQDPVRIDDQ
jgi:hypothetical protein